MKQDVLWRIHLASSERRFLAGAGTTVTQAGKCVAEDSEERHFDGGHSEVDIPSLHGDIGAHTLQK